MVTTPTVATVNVCLVPQYCASHTAAQLVAAVTMICTVSQSTVSQGTATQIVGSKCTAIMCTACCCCLYALQNKLWYSPAKCSHYGCIQQGYSQQGAQCCCCCRHEMRPMTAMKAQGCVKKDLARQDCSVCSALTIPHALLVSVKQLRSCGEGPAQAVAMQRHLHICVTAEVAAGGFHPCWQASADWKDCYNSLHQQHQH